MKNKINDENADYYERNYGNMKKNMNQKEHFHELDGMTISTENHEHKYFGKTRYIIGYGEKHVHYYNIYTDLDGDHCHKIFGRTGLGIKTKDGHVHLFDGYTSLKDDHTHYFGGYTSSSRD